MENYQRFGQARMASACSDSMDNFPVAMAYVPWQNWNTVYDLEKALTCGTIFPELNKPFLGVRDVKGGCR